MVFHTFEKIPILSESQSALIIAACDQTEQAEIMKSVSRPAIEGLDIEPAFANVFNVVVNPLMTRIALGEFVAGDPKKDSRYHRAFVMPTGDAIELARLILSLAEQNQKQNAVGEKTAIQ